VLVLTAQNWRISLCMEVCHYAVIHCELRKPCMTVTSIRLSRKGAPNRSTCRGDVQHFGEITIIQYSPDTLLQYGYWSNTGSHNLLATVATYARNWTPRNNWHSLRHSTRPFWMQRSSSGTVQSLLVTQHRNSLEKLPARYTGRSGRAVASVEALLFGPKGLK